MKKRSSPDLLVPLPFRTGEPAPGNRLQLGEMGAALQELARAGAPLPTGFILPVGLGALVLEERNGVPEALGEAIETGLSQLEAWAGRRLGDPQAPLLVSVRASAPAAVPMAMPAVLNLGLSEAVVRTLIAAEREPRQVWDAYARFLRGYGEHVLKLEPGGFEEMLEPLVERHSAEGVYQLDAAALEQLAGAYLERLRGANGAKLPAEPREQLTQALLAGFRAWNHSRAVAHRHARSLDGLRGTAMVVQTMAWGTGKSGCGAGHLFSRVPADGEKRLYGRYLPAAQGPDLTAGERMPDSLDALKKRDGALWQQLDQWATTLERQFQDAVEVQFTVEDTRLYLLSVKSARRSAQAALRVALDLVEEGIGDERHALRHLDPKLVDHHLHPVLDKSSHPTLLVKGLPASPGSAVGQVVFFAEHAEELHNQGLETILVRHETTPEDINGLKVACGILTATGGLTSHAAVVARGMGKCCVVGATDVSINYHINEMTIGEVTVKRLDWVSLDGNTGEVFLGKLPQIAPTLQGGLAKVLGWADKQRRMGVRANADTPEDARRAVELGAEGIGLCRTEHMFFALERIPIFRKMILAVDEVGRAAALAELLPLQRKDFMDILRVMAGRPVTIRLLDPPLNEFLPRGIRSQTRMAKAMGIPLEVIQRRTEVLTEANPMLGHRGCRLAITYPEIYQMQVRAIVEAACIVMKEGVPVQPEIMVPLVSTTRELEVIREMIEELARRVMAELGETFPLRIGTMIETPRAAVVSRAIAPHADFYSFGTNDLTQMTYGFSRDDTGIFMPSYLERGILDTDPFIELDQEGVGALVKWAVEQGREVNPELKIGICG
ncbi:MAG: pyruvate, phosphate dikinase, partial [Candidatus Lambdaproteobacteria bacterium]|nr:pyruvate, phosphate dikinase [Candidatus Lambdaproteobacteria bacterium]